MLTHEELREFSRIKRNDDYYVSLFLNVDPLTNVKGDYIIHLKNMVKEKKENLEKDVYKSVMEDMNQIESFIFSERRNLKKSVAIVSCMKNNLWKAYHLSVPLKNEIVIEKTPYIKPLIDILGSYKKYGIILVDKESARIFLAQLGEIMEYVDVSTADIPGKHKKGGWFALAQNHYARHIDYHVTMHLKDVLKHIEAFLTREKVDALILSGSDEAVSMFKAVLPSTMKELVKGEFNAEMFANIDEIHKRAEPVINEVEIQRHKDEVSRLITDSLKNRSAVIGLDDVLSAVHEGKVRKLLFIKDFRASGFHCSECGFLTTQPLDECPYCKVPVEKINHIVDLAAQKSIETGAIVEIVPPDIEELKEKGNIGAFLRF